MERINLMDVTQGKQNLTLETKNKTQTGRTDDTQGTTVQQSKLKLKLLQQHKGVVGQGICGGVFFLAFSGLQVMQKQIQSKGKNKGIPNGQQGL